MKLAGEAERLDEALQGSQTFSVGCVPYLNAKPLVYAFRQRGASSPVTVHFDVPSRLPALLEDGLAQAILVSSIEALRAPSRVVSEVSIASNGPVRSVRLFSQVPFDSIRRLALDRSSMTSNALVQIVLRERYGVDCESLVEGPELGRMLSQADAGVLIGDAGMRTDGTGLHVLDMGEAWTSLTGLPFVWAVWLGGDELETPLANELRSAARWGEAHLDTVVPFAAIETGFDEVTARDYLGTVMDYRLSAPHLKGLALFGQKLREHGLLDRIWEPTFV